MNLFHPEGRYRRDWSGRLFVLSPGDIPTVDFYVRSRVERSPDVSAIYRDSRYFDAWETVLEEGTFVVIVRHIGAAWLRWLADQASRLSGVAYLMDDDIPAAWRCRDVPLDYGLWTSGRYLLAWWGLSRVCDRIWVSTEVLARRYAACQPRVVPPLSVDYSGRRASPEGVCRWGYHGTRIHGRELRWLLPIVEAVQRRVPDAEFEVFGGQQVVRMFARIPRVHVMAPLPWQSYLAHCRASALAVGLAPMLPGYFNEARSCTKVFDIVRCGAVGVFSERMPYSPSLASSGAALLPDDPHIWEAEIENLLLNDMERMQRYEKMHDWMEQVSREGNIAELIMRETRHR